MESIVNSSSLHIVQVPTDSGQTRIDSFIAQQFPHYSRTFFQKLIEQDLITLNNKKVKSSTPVKPEDTIHINFPPPRLIIPTWSAESIKILQSLSITIVYQHEHFLIISKPAGLMVHKPSYDNPTLTLVDWLLYHFSHIASVGCENRPGIVHRLDKDTSGLMIIPTTNYAHMIFGNMFKERNINKTYLAIVQGIPPTQGTIDFPIGRDTFQPIKMSHSSQSGRSALTHFTVQEYGNGMALLIAKPITGRTHQIRVHCAASGFPIIGDTVYGKKSSLIERQALHAINLSFTFEGQEFSFQQEPPHDIQKLIETMKRNN